MTPQPTSKRYTSGVIASSRTPTCPHCGSDTDRKRGDHYDCGSAADGSEQTLACEIMAAAYERGRASVLAQISARCTCDDNGDCMYCEAAEAVD